MFEVEHEFLADMRSALRFCGDCEFRTEGDLESAYPVTPFASASIAAAGLAVSELAGGATVSVDRRLTSHWFGLSIRPIGWQLPNPWDPFTGDYEASDGWIRLHTNAPHHRAAALRVLGSATDRAELAARVATWKAEDLESAVVAEHGCAAKMYCREEWAAHPQGVSVRQEPLVQWNSLGSAATDWHPTRTRPLQGVRVLDLTRVLAGPVASRFLAGFGAEVLRIDPPGWNEPAVEPEVNLGKRCARLDLRQEPDRQCLRNLMKEADVVLHGYRADALEHLGFGPEERRALAPKAVDVCLCAYGWTGPWHNRRGFDSLVQMSAGIAHQGMLWKGASNPTPLPVQALDHATGYLLAAAVVRALHVRHTTGERLAARLSLARTAELLAERHELLGNRPTLQPLTDADFSPGIERTAWGDAKRLRPPLTIEGTSMEWTRPATNLGSSEAAWTS